MVRVVFDVTDTGKGQIDIENKTTLELGNETEQLFAGTLLAVIQRTTEILFQGTEDERNVFFELMELE